MVPRRQHSYTSAKDFKKREPEEKEDEDGKGDGKLNRHFLESLLLLVPSSEEYHHPSHQGLAASHAWPFFFPIEHLLLPTDQTPLESCAHPLSLGKPKAPFF